MDVVYNRFSASTPQHRSQLHAILGLENLMRLSNIRLCIPDRRIGTIKLTPQRPFHKVRAAGAAQRESTRHKVQPTRVPRDSVVAQRVNRRCVPRRVQQYTVVFIAFVVCTFAGNGDASTHSRPHQHISFDTVRHHLAACICAHGGRIYRAVRPI